MLGLSQRLIRLCLFHLLRQQDSTQIRRLMLLAMLCGFIIENHIQSKSMTRFFMKSELKGNVFQIRVIDCIRSIFCLKCWEIWPKVRLAILQTRFVFGKTSITSFVVECSRGWHEFETTALTDAQPTHHQLTSPHTDFVWSSTQAHDHYPHHVPCVQALK